MQTHLVAQKVDANLTPSLSRSIDIGIPHGHLGHLKIGTCHVMVNHRLVGGVENIVGKEEFCAYGHSKESITPPLVLY